MEVTSKRSKPKKDLLAKRTLKSLLDKPDQDLATIITESRGHIGIDLKRVRSSGLLVAVDSNDLHDASVILKSKSDFFLRISQPTSCANEARYWSICGLL